jgi:hypothetical protein
VVSETAEGFAVSAHVMQAGHSLVFDVELRMADLEMRAMIGHVGYTSPLLSTPVTAQDCSFQLLHEDDVAPGRAWLQFACTNLRPLGSDTDILVGCAIGVSTVAVRNCN